MTTARTGRRAPRAWRLLPLLVAAAALAAAPRAQAKSANCNIDWNGDTAEIKVNLKCDDVGCTPGFNSTQIQVVCSEGPMTCNTNGDNNGTIGWTAPGGEDWVDDCYLVIPAYLNGDHLVLNRLANGVGNLSGVVIGAYPLSTRFNLNDSTTNSIDAYYKWRSRYTYNVFVDGTKDASLSSTSGWTAYGTAVTATPAATQTVSGQTYRLTGWSGATGALLSALGSASGSISGSSYSKSFTVNESDCEVNWLYTPAYDLTVSLAYTPTATGLDSYASASPHLGTASVGEGLQELRVNRAIRTAPTNNWRYYATGWSNGSGSLAIPGAAACVEDSQGRCTYTANITTASALTWNYRKQELFYSTFDASVPQAVRDNLHPVPPACDSFATCTNWYDDGSTRQPSVSQKALDNAGNPWVCSAWSGSINGVAQSGDGATGPVFAITQPSWIQWTCGEVRSLDVTVSGLPAGLVSGFSPTVDLHDVSMADHELQAPKVIYDSSQENRYVLVAYSYNDGTDTVSGDIDPDAEECAGDAAKVCRTVTVSDDSAFNWHYRKEVRLTVAVNGLASAADAGARECGGIDNADLCIGWANGGAAGATVSGSAYYPENTPVVATALASVAGGTVRTLISAVVYGVSGAAETSANGRKAFSFVLVNPVRLVWLYEETDLYDVGQPIAVPAGADGATRPVIIMPGVASDAVWDTYFYWGGYPRKLYAIRPVTAFSVQWRPLAGTVPVNSRASLAQWPAALQTHVMNAPVGLKPAGSPFSFTRVMYSTIPSSRIETSEATFNASAPGVSVLLFATGPVPDDLNYPVSFVVAETMPWSDPRIAEYPADAVPIGSPLTSATLPLTKNQPPGVPFVHADPEGKNGFVYHEAAYYDGTGAKRAYDRATRTGNIIPVNKPAERDAERQMVVVWYAIGAKGLGWPVKPVRYLCDWPAAAPAIDLASGLGYGPLDPGVTPDAMLYVQPDAALPGFNPNEEHAVLFGTTVYAARDDLNTVRGVTTSAPYVLLKHRDPAAAGTSWLMKVLAVTRGTFAYDLDVGTPILPPAPLALWVPYAAESSVVAGAAYQHRTYNGTIWAVASNLPAEVQAEVGVRWHYPLQAGFYYPDFDRDGSPDAAEGDPVPFLNGGQDHDDPPATVLYRPHWPAAYPSLKVGQTLTTGGNGLPDVFHMAVAKVVYDEGVYRGDGPLAKLIEPLAWREVPLAAVPAGMPTEEVAGRVRFPGLPYYLRSRLSYLEAAGKLVFEGTYDDTQGGDPFLLLDVMNLRERDLLADPAQGGSLGWVPQVQGLYELTRNPRGLTFAGTVQNPYNPAKTHTAAAWKDLWGIYLGLDRDAAGNPVPLEVKGVPMALTAGMARGDGWVVLVENDDEDLGQPPAVHVMRVEGPAYRGELRVIDAVDNVFDEKVTLRHTGDFGGEPEKFCFEWRIAEDLTGLPPALPPAGSWELYDDGGDPCGKLDVTIRGANPRTLADNWVTVRYDYSGAFPFLSAGAGYPWSAYTPAQLAQGWIKRVVGKLNPFEARVKSFHQSATDTLVSMIAQLGGRYEGPVAMNSSADNLNSIGLIEAYETVLRQGLLFSIDAVPPVSNEPVNRSLLFVTSRIADFWALLGNEAYADAVDPTIGIDTDSALDGFGSLAPSVHAFQNQADSLLDEELALLRGRDESTGRVDRRPVYNRLTWNFTGGSGEVAYAVSYNVGDGNGDGVVDEYDAAAMFPQGHGDAWGHYLSALGAYYRLLGHPHYDWVPRAEAVLVGGAPVLVDFQDERKFAAIAANKARAGYDIVDLTYRKHYVDDPDGQWQGYTDPYAERAWGVDEWARRAGQGTLFDWVTANAVLPEAELRQDRVDDTGNPVPADDIQQIKRAKVPELDAIAGKAGEIQALMDKADRGLNPLGLAKGSVPFDLSPSAILEETHFEQVHARAEKALANAVTVFDYANSFSRRLRANQDSVEDFRRTVAEQERDYRNRLIEIYGYPYPEDATFPDGYDGPDLFHFMYVDVPELTGELPTQGGSPDEDVVAFTVDFQFGGEQLDPDLGIAATTMPVAFHLNTQRSWLEKPAGWSSRRAPGAVQLALGELIKAHADYQRALTEYDQLLGDAYDAKEVLEARYQVAATQISILNANNQKQTDLAKDIQYNTRVAVGLRRVGEITKDVMDGIADGVADGLGVGLLKAGGAGIKGVMDIAADAMEMKNLDVELARDEYERGMDLKLAVNDARYEVLQLVKELQGTVSGLVAKKQELYLLKEVILQAAGQYQQLVAEGARLLEERTQQRRYAAADVQDYRYQDMAYRVFRDDALQKYRAQFDVAARYVYLAAAAYDYETNLLGSSASSGRRFLADIVRERSLGQFLDGAAVAGQPGLADPLARLAQNFDVYRGQLGFNNPQYERNRFSLRDELYRLDGPGWTAKLAAHRVSDLWQVPAFKRFCRPFAPAGLGAQPGLVIPFSTTVTFGQNFFDQPLGGGDSAYDPTNFATKIRSVGVWFEGYDAAGLSFTPRVYLVPAGADVLRSPADDAFATREWKVVDQKLPVPFPIGVSDLAKPDWIPLHDTLGEDYGGIRRLSSFRAYHDTGDWSQDETTQDTRLVGRSVWNTKWFLIVPGGTLLADPVLGLDRFVESVTDIKLTFSTYAYSGN